MRWDERWEREELQVSAHPSAQFRVRARQGRAGLGLRNLNANIQNDLLEEVRFSMDWVNNFYFIQLFKSPTLTLFVLIRRLNSLIFTRWLNIWCVLAQAVRFWGIFQHNFIKLLVICSTSPWMGLGLKHFRRGWKMWICRCFLILWFSYPVIFCDVLTSFDYS